MTNDNATLETFDAPTANADQIYKFETSELSALCPFDFGGPDYYEMTLIYSPNNLAIESKSLKKYLEAFRDVEITAEELGAEMYESLVNAIEPNHLYLRLEQARRGGIEETVELGDKHLRE
ncbi:7-cyano-7-deazaguanine reductase [Haloprofundus halophilus]|uniref:7-cyano-7-deazaguanine reductase n=1 Tax=Haloprofundus halophilus TaxID=2283527 RepID=UPI000E4445BA|nr:7-cyano-7-deazaguanine reductase [Haloprofundus halophilus]